MSRFKPVFLPADRDLNGRASQTFLRHYAACPRSGYLYQLHRGETRTREMERGKALHAVLERAVRTALEHDEPAIPPELVKVIADEVLADPAYAVPFEEHDRVREMAYRWASEAGIDPGAVVAVETLFALDIAGVEVRCRVDFAELVERGEVVKVQDYKSSMAAAPFDEVARKRPDGTLAARSFQLVLYALALAFGVPVREEGEGDERVETREPFPIAGRARHFDLEYVYPALEGRDGRMIRRPMSLTRLELDEYRVSLEGIVRRALISQSSGDWPAVVSDQACAECPASAECPIPAEVRDWRGLIDSPERAADALERRAVVKAEQAAISRELRAYVAANGPVHFGNGMVAEIGQRSSERIADKDALFAALERSVRYGEPFDRGQFVKAVDSFSLVERRVSVDEVAALAAEEGSG
jgi:hypothetical protein